MRIFPLSTILSLLLVLASSNSHAERAADIKALPKDSRILAYLTDKSATKALYELGSNWDKKLGIGCSGEYSVKVHPAYIVVLKPIDFPNETKHPTDGIWLYKFELSRCGSAKIYSALVVAQKEGAPRFIEFVPGTTIASPILVRDTLPIVYLKLSFESQAKENRKCDDFIIKDTSLTVVPQLSASGNSMSISSPYEELWVARYCGEDRSVLICFRPKPDGGTSITAQACKEVG